MRAGRALGVVLDDERRRSRNARRIVDVTRSDPKLVVIVAIEDRELPDHHHRQQDGARARDRALGERQRARPTPDRRLTKIRRPDARWIAYGAPLMTAGIGAATRPMTMSSRTRGVLRRW